MTNERQGLSSSIRCLTTTASRRPSGVYTRLWDRPPPRSRAPTFPTSSPSEERAVTGAPLMESVEGGHRHHVPSRRDGKRLRPSVGDLPGSLGGAHLPGADRGSAVTWLTKSVRPSAPIAVSKTCSPSEKTPVACRWVSRASNRPSSVFGVRAVSMAAAASSRERSSERALVDRAASRLASATCPRGPGIGRPVIGGLLELRGESRGDEGEHERGRQAHRQPAGPGPACGFLVGPGPGGGELRPRRGRSRRRGTRAPPG